jgi:hypothetical protein
LHLPLIVGLNAISEFCVMVFSMRFEHLSCACGCGQATCCELALASNEEDDKQKKSPNKKSGRLLFRDNSYDTLIQIFDK